MTKLLNALSGKFQKQVEDFQEEIFTHFSKLLYIIYSHIQPENTFYAKWTTPTSFFLIMKTMSFSGVLLFQLPSCYSFDWDTTALDPNQERACEGNEVLLRCLSDQHINVSNE